MPYSYWQIGWSIGIAGVAALAVFLCRQSRAAATPIRMAIAVALVSFELQRFFTESIAFPDRMPFYLCNVSTWAAVFACLTLNSLSAEFVYFVGLSGALMTLLTPDHGSHWPAAFFLNHGGIILGATVLVFGKSVRMRPGAPLRAFGMGVIYFVAGAVFDGHFGTNYSFTMHKAGRTTLLDYLGPWPFYWLPGTGIAACLIWLLWLPLRTAHPPAPLFAAQDRERFLA